MTGIAIPTRTYDDWNSSRTFVLLSRWVNERFGEGSSNENEPLESLEALPPNQNAKRRLSSFFHGESRYGATRASCRRMPTRRAAFLKTAGWHFQRLSHRISLTEPLLSIQEGLQKWAYASITLVGVT